MTVVPHPCPTVYVLPGRRYRVVMTTAIAERLTAGQRAAAVAHERAHLAGHHHALIRCVRVLECAFPGVPPFRVARQQTARLMEMIADDRAAARTSRHDLVKALVAAACTSVPEGALGMTGADTVERVQRLLTPAEPSPPGLRLRAVGTAVLLVALPVLTVVLPISAAA